MIKSLGLEGFKAFKEFNNIDFSKINIFLGPNSSGKSSFLKGLLTIYETLKSSDKNPAIQLSDEIGDFKSIVYGNDEKKKITFTLKLSQNYIEDLEKHIVKERNEFSIFATFRVLDLEQITYNDFQEFMSDYYRTYRKENVRFFSFTIKETPKKPNVVDSFSIEYNNGDHCCIYMKRNSYYIKFNEYEYRTPNLLKPYKFLFKVNEHKYYSLPRDEVKGLLKIVFALKEIEVKLSSFTKDLIHIEPFRDKPSRTQLIANNKFNSVGSRGENTLGAVLGLNEFNSKKLLMSERVNEWLDYFDLAQSVEVEELKNNNYSLLIKNKFTGIPCNIVDVGVGTSQLLPIIIESIISPNNSLLLIEEPETHIHPNAQAKLADLFVSCSNTQNKRFIIETHSMYLVRQLQILVAKGDISPKDIKIYYFQQGENGTNTMNYKILDNGQFEEDFPKGFFDVPYQLNKTFLKFI